MRPPSRLLEDAGFGEVHTSELPVSAGFADGGEYLDPVADTAGPIACGTHRPGQK